MPDVTLVSGPYRSPRIRPGRTLYCEWRGDVRVTGVTDAPIPWPYHASQRRRPLPILAGDLVRAVRVESVAAVAYHWGVSRWTVRRWRHVLSVERFNAGTVASWRRQAATKLVRARASKRCS